MSKQEMIDFVDEQIQKGIERENAIRLLALCLNHDYPENKVELWFQQVIGGG